MAVCRSCGAEGLRLIVSLGPQPLANSYLTREALGRMEPFYPMDLMFCPGCLLVQLEAVVSAESIFTEYAYFSSYSTSWLDHARAYAEMAASRFSLGRDSLVVELASNDGYLLQYFVERGVPVLGIEPAKNVARAAREKGVPTEAEFFGTDYAARLAGRGGRADLIVGNNVLAHVPDLNDFVGGMRVLLKPGGTVTMEFPHLVRMIEGNQFDTIYHEHFSYFSLLAVERIFARHALTIYDVEELPTHGGSLRIYARHEADALMAVSARVAGIRAREEAMGYGSFGVYEAFAERVMAAKRNLLEFLIEARRGGRRIVGYGAPAKGNTLLNYSGARTDFIEYTVDRSPHKQGLFLPGTHIPILAPGEIDRTRPDFVLILPWNLREEIMGQMRGIRQWGGRFVVPIPSVEVL